MSHFQRKKEIFNKPLRLTEEEEANPILAIDEFFQKYNLSEVRQLNQQMDQVCLSTDSPPYEDADERAVLLSYREDEETVMEAAFLLWQMSESRPNPISPDPPEKSHHSSFEFDEIQRLVKGLAEMEVDVAKLCEVIVPAWCKAIAALTERSETGAATIKPASSTSQQPLNLDFLNNTIIQVQGKLAKLTLIALSLYSNALPILK